MHGNQCIKHQNFAALFLSSFLKEFFPKHEQSRYFGL